MNIIYSDDVLTLAKSTKTLQNLADLQKSGLNTLFFYWDPITNLQRLNTIRSTFPLNTYKYVMKIDPITWYRYFITCGGRPDCSVPESDMTSIVQFVLNNADLFVGYYTFDEPAGSQTSVFFQESVYKVIRKLDTDFVNRPVTLCQTKYFPDSAYYSPNAQDVLFIDQYSPANDVQIVWYRALQADQMLNRPIVPVFSSESQSCSLTNSWVSAQYSASLKGIQTTHSAPNVNGVGVYLYREKPSTFDAPFNMGNCESILQDTKNTLKASNQMILAQHLLSHPMNVYFGVNAINPTSADTKTLDQLYQSGVNTLVLPVNWNNNVDKLLSSLSLNPVLSKFRYILSFPGDVYDQYYSVCRGNPACTAPSSRITYLTQVAKNYPTLVAGYHPFENFNGYSASYQRAVYQGIRSLDSDFINRPVFLTTYMDSSVQAQYYEPNAYDISFVMSYASDTPTQVSTYQGLDSYKMLSRPFIPILPAVKDSCSSYVRSVYEASHQAFEALKIGSRPGGVAFVNFTQSNNFTISNCNAISSDVFSVLAKEKTRTLNQFWHQNPMKVISGVPLASLRNPTSLKLLRKLYQQGMNTIILPVSWNGNVADILAQIRNTTDLNGYKYILSFNGDVYDMYHFFGCGAVSSCSFFDARIKYLVQQIGNSNPDLVAGYLAFNAPSAVPFPATFQDSVYNAIRSYDSNATARPVVAIHSAWFANPAYYSASAQDMSILEQWSTSVADQTAYYTRLRSFGLTTRPFVIGVPTGTSSCQSFSLAHYQAATAAVSSLGLTAISAGFEASDFQSGNSASSLSSCNLIQNDVTTILSRF
jgi:hypothetical protein